MCQSVGGWASERTEQRASQQARSGKMSLAVGYIPKGLIDIIQPCKQNTKNPPGTEHKLTMKCMKYMKVTIDNKLVLVVFV